MTNVFEVYMKKKLVLLFLVACGVFDFCFEYVRYVKGVYYILFGRYG